MSEVKVRKNFWMWAALVTNVIWASGLVGALSVRAMRHAHGDYVADPPSNPQYQDRMSLFAVSMKRWSGACDVLFLGDSHTQRGLFSEFYPDLRVVNRGIGSDTSDGALSRLSDIGKLSPRKLVLWLGCNDYGSRVPPSHVAANVEEIIGRVKRDSPMTSVAIVGLIPSADGKQLGEGWRTAVNALLQQVAQRANASYIAIFDDFSGGGQYIKDKVHLNGKGYMQMLKKLDAFVYGKKSAQSAQSAVKEGTSD